MQEINKKLDLMLELQKNMQQDIINLDKKIDKVEERLDKKIDENYAKLDSKIDENYAKLDSKIEENYAKLDSKIEENYAKLDSKIDENYERLDNKIDENYAKLDSKIDENYAKLDSKIDENYAKLDSKIDENYKKLDYKINENYDRLDRKIEQNHTEMILCYEKLNNKIDNNYWITRYANYVDMERNYQKRPIVLAKRTGLADHRYGIIYTGKTDVDFETLKDVARYNVLAPNYGLGFYAHDMGGFENGSEFLKALSDGEKPELVLLDIMLPRLDGISVLRQIRNENIEIPVLMLTAKSSVADKVNGLNAGADDYLTKPFDKEELVARVRALTRRKGNLIFNEIVYEDLILDLNSICLRCKDREVGLSFKEFEIARIMLSEPKMTFSKDLLISRAWGFDSEVSDNNVEAYVSFLRKKLKFLKSKVSIKVIRKVGYRLEVCDA